MINNRIWPENEIEYLKKYYGIYPNLKLAFVLQRSTSAIKSKAYELKLTSKHHKKEPRKSHEIYQWDIQKENSEKMENV